MTFRTWRKYFELTKPKVTLLNLLVGVTCFLLAAYPTINWLKLAAFAIVGYLAAGGCGVLNSAYDQDIDKLMQRTSKRAIPAGYITTNKAFTFGAALVTVSLIFAYVLFNVLTFLMLTLGLVFYLLIYTVWLKRTSPWNVVIGGFAGCFAAFAGWAAAAGTLSVMALLVATLDFLWTPGHLWGLAIKKVEEYRKAKVPMLPIKFGKTKAAQSIFWLNTATVAFSFLFPLLNLTGAVYSSIAIVAGTALLTQSLWLAVSPSENNGFRVFVLSIPYLAFLMFGLMMDKLVFI
jgi:heme o synthase